MSRFERGCWAKEVKQDVALKAFIFVLSPFFAFLYSLRTVKTKSSFVVFFLASIFFGMAFSVPYGKYGWDTSFDAQHYRVAFSDYINLSFEEFYDLLLNFLSFDDGKKDFYFDTIAFYTSRFTDNYHALFTIFTVVFAFFALKSLKFLVLESNFDKSISSYLILYLFTVNQIFNINGVRFWTASWIAVYCIFKIYRNGNLKYLILVALTPFIHGVFWIFIGVLILIKLLKGYERFWLFMFFLSFATSSLAFQFLEYTQSYLPSFLSLTVESYTSVEAIQKRGLQTAWVPVLFKTLIFLYLNLMLVIFIKHSKEIKNNLKTKNLYLFLLIWMTIFNFMMFVPSLGERFVAVVYPVFAYVWLVSFNTKQYRWVLYFLPVVFSWLIYTQLQNYNYVLSYDFYISSPVYIIYKYLIVS